MKGGDPSEGLPLTGHLALAGGAGGGEGRRSKGRAGVPKWREAGKALGRRLREHGGRGRARRGAGRTWAVPPEGAGRFGEHTPQVSRYPEQPAAGVGGVAAPRSARNCAPGTTPRWALCRASPDPTATPGGGCCRPVCPEAGGVSRCPQPAPLPSSQTVLATCGRPRRFSACWVGETWGPRGRPPSRCPTRPFLTVCTLFCCSVGVR